MEKPFIRNEIREVIKEVEVKVPYIIREIEVVEVEKRVPYIIEKK